MYKKNILITWVWKGIWNYLYNKFKSDFNVLWISKNTKLDDNCLLVDLTNKNEIIDFCYNDKLKNINFDFIVLNAWIWYYWDFMSNTLEEYEEIINLNLLANIRLLYLLERNIIKSTKFIFIWSIASKKFLKKWSVYISSKFAIRWFAWALKTDWKKVHIINPSIVDTSFHDWKVDIINNIKKNKFRGYI